jgi:hypothetical protein
MTHRPSERLTRAHRLTRGRDYTRVRGEGQAFRGRFCLML